MERWLAAGPQSGVASAFRFVESPAGGPAGGTRAGRIASMLRAALVLIALGSSVSAQPPSFARLLDPGPAFPPMAIDPPPGEAAFHLGARLFEDGILSRDRSISCRSCHDPAHGFAHPDPFPAGVGGRRARRHAPTLVNRGFGKSQRWDGSVSSLEAFVVQPIEDPQEMDLPLAEALDRLRTDEAWRQGFEGAFGRGPDRDTLALALATFVRGIVAEEGPYDRFIRGYVPALDREAVTGLWIFESKGRCWQCHPPPFFTDESFHNTGVGVLEGRAEPGREEATGEPRDRGRFKTPTLRGIRRTAPYMHDGSLPTLEAVIDFYDRGGTPNPALSPRMQPIGLDASEKARLLAFLRVL
jgi:cytochrome c peroxidase